MGSAFVVLLVLATAVYAATAGSVAWGTGQPTVAAGTITGSGTYTVNAGWTASSSVLVAIPTNGGSPLLMAGAVGGGKWGPITLNSVPTGQYNVYGEVIYTQTGQPSQTIVTPVATVNVP
jgi:hypothetical protein